MTKIEMTSSEAPMDYIQFFRQSSPYIHAHRGRIVVIMLSGAARGQPHFPDLAQDIALLNSLGIRIVLVYGARAQIEDKCRRSGAPMHVEAHPKVIGRDFLNAAKEALGQARFDIEARLTMGIVNAPTQGVRTQVVSANVIMAKPIGVIDGVDCQYAGEIRRIDHKTIFRLLEQDHLILIPNIASSPTGELFYLELEAVAAHVAGALHAHKLILLNDYQEVYHSDGSLLRQLSPQTARACRDNSTDHQLKSALQAMLDASAMGVRRSHLLDYSVDGVLLRELFTRDGVGTMVTEEAYDQIREAVIDDVAGILELIAPLEAQGVLVRRSRKRLEQVIHQFVLAERDGMIIGCAALHPFTDGQGAELGCVVVHPDYRNGQRASLLLQHLEEKARAKGIAQLFALTTKTAHWFLERGFCATSGSALPKERQLYNLQRNSKVLVKTL